MRIPILTNALIRFKQFRDPGLGETELKLFENPSESVTHDLDQLELQRVSGEIVRELNKGHNTVAVNVGKMHIEDFLFSQHTIGSNITSHLSRSQTLKNISDQTGRRIGFLQGVKWQGEHVISKLPEWHFGGKEAETFYALIADLDRSRFRGIMPLSA